MGIAFALMVIGTVLARPSEGSEVALALTDRVSGHPVTFATLPTGIWQGEIGEGFRPGVHTLSLEAGGAGGLGAPRGRRAPHFALSRPPHAFMFRAVSPR